MRAAIYARVSSDPRGIGRSTAEQQADCRLLADREGWTVVDTFVDNDRSASRFANAERPAYRKLVSFLQAGGADVLVTWEASRAQRDLDAYVKLRDLCRDNGVLWSYSGRTYDLQRTDDAFTTGLDALLAEREASLTRDRVLRAVQANAAAGKPHGRLTYGYERVYDPQSGVLVRQVVSDDQAAVIREAARRVLGGETCYAVAKDFNARSIPTPGNGARGWDLTQVKRICLNPAYIAKRVHRGKVVGDADWPPILPEDQFYALQSKLNDPQRLSRREGAVRHLLSGIARCGVCGRGLLVQKNRGFLAYYCPNGFHVSRHEDKLDEFVTAVVTERLSRPDVLELLDSSDTEDTAAARAEAAEKKARLEGFYDAAAAGDLTPAALSRIERTLLREIGAAERRARPVEVPAPLADLVGSDVEKRWETLPMTARREVIDALMTIEVHRTGRGRRTFDPKNINIAWKTS